MRRLALLVLAGALACGEDLPELQAGPRDTFTFPTGLGVLSVDHGGGVVDRRLFVVSSNAELEFESDTGGSVIAVDPPDLFTDPTALASGLNIPSFAGELGMAHPAACPALVGVATAIVPMRGTNLVHRLAVGPLGELTCDGCAISVGNAERGDPFTVGIACDTATSPGGPTIARAFVGHLRSSNGLSWLTQIDLTLAPTEARHVLHVRYQQEQPLLQLAGQIRGFAYDSSRKRLYFTRTVVSSEAALTALDLANDCKFELLPADGGCRVSTTPTGNVPSGLELRGIALSNETDPAALVRRAYVTARIYDAAQAALAGVRVGDFDGLLLVVDLSEDVAGRLDFRIVDQIPIGYGASYVRVLPLRPGKRDVVAALAQDDGVLWIYDDDTGERVAIGRDLATGAPLVGRGPFPLVVDPVPLAAVGVLPERARVYVGSFNESFVTPVDVPLLTPGDAAIVMFEEAPLRIGPRIPQVTP